jgi:hypothetical protein
MEKARALFVSLSQTYPELRSAKLTHKSEALKNLTCGWWFINLEKAKGVRYVFGVFKGKVVSAYRVVKDMESTAWPTIEKWPLEDRSGTENRKYVPTNKVTVPEWKTAKSWPKVRMYGSTRYGTVEENPVGTLAKVDPELDKADGAP